MDNVEPEGHSPNSKPGANFACFTPPLNSEQQSQLDAQLYDLNDHLAAAIEKLEKLYQPLYVHKEADLYKQPESSLLDYVKQLTASATANVLDVLESLPLTLETAKNENLSLLEKLNSDHEASKSITISLSELTEHLSSQNKVIDSISLAHSNILSMQSFQDLTSQAVIRAESFVGEIKQEMENAHKSVFSFSELEKNTRESQPALQAEAALDDTSQLDQADVDSLFASIVK